MHLGLTQRRACVFVARLRCEDVDGSVAVRIRPADEPKQLTACDNRKVRIEEDAMWGRHIPDLGLQLELPQRLFAVIYHLEFDGVPSLAQSFTQNQGVSGVVFHIDYHRDVCGPLPPSAWAIPWRHGRRNRLTAVPSPAISPATPGPDDMRREWMDWPYAILWQCRPGAIRGYVLGRMRNTSSPAMSPGITLKKWPQLRLCDDL